MLQVAFIRQNVELVKQRLAVRNFKQPELIDELLQWDDKRKQYQLEQEDIQAKLNTASKAIGQLMAKGEKEAAEQKKQEVASLKNSLNPEKMQSLFAALNASPPFSTSDLTGFLWMSEKMADEMDLASSAFCIALKKSSPTTVGSVTISGLPSPLAAR